MDVFGVELHFMCGGFKVASSYFHLNLLSQLLQLQLSGATRFRLLFRTVKLPSNGLDRVVLY